MKRVLLVILGLLCLSGTAHAETPGEMAKKADQAYQGGDYPRAVQLWQGLASLGFINGNLYYNLSNAHWRMGQVGQARRYLLKALRLKPRDADIRANLNFIQETLGEGGGREGLWALIEGIPWWRLSLSFSESLKLTAILSFCFFTLLLLRKRKQKQGRFLSGYPLGFFLMLACAWLLYLYANDHLLNRAVVIHPDAPLLKAPTEQSVSVQGLKEGNLLKVRKTQGDFKLVKTSAGGEGWVKKDQIGEI